MRWGRGGWQTVTRQKSLRPDFAIDRNAVSRVGWGRELGLPALVDGVRCHKAVTKVYLV